MALSIESTVTLNNGVKIPLFGLGVWRTLPGKETSNAVLSALKYGYRHIDTAHFYKNEKDVGEGLRQSGVSRDFVFLTTKLWNEDHGYDKAIRGFGKSLELLNTPYVDLYLIHFPVRKKRLDSWKAIETLYEDGKCRAIGVSNYTIRHLEELLGTCKIKPTVNQVEFHPWLYQRELFDFCRKNDIALEAYSPLAKGQKVNDPKLLEIAQRYRKSGAQLLIRWSLQRGCIVIPKSSNPERIRENAAVFDFEISEEDLKIIDGFHENLRVAWDPTNEP